MTGKRRLWGRRVAGLLSMALCVCLSLAFLNEFCVDKGHYRDLKRIMYEDPENSYPLIFAGGSHISGAINPNHFKKIYGVSSFNSSTGGQEFYETYYLLKEILKRQDPEVVVLDAYYAMNQSPYGDPSFTHRVLDPMRMGPNKLEAISVSVEENVGSYLFPFLLYHSRWENFPQLISEWADYVGPYKGALGFTGGPNQYGKELQYDNWDDTHCTPLAEKQEEYLQKFFALAREEGFELILINFPCELESDELTEWAGDAVGKMNQIKKEAAAAGVPMLDLNRPEMIEAMDFDFPTMMSNASHVNYYGAYNVTEYVGKYLQEVTPELFENAEPAAS